MKKKQKKTLETLLKGRVTKTVIATIAGAKDLVVATVAVAQ